MISAAEMCQDIHQHGLQLTYTILKTNSSPLKLYLKNNRWEEGLLSVLMLVLGCLREVNSC